MLAGIDSRKEQIATGIYASSHFAAHHARCSNHLSDEKLSCSLDRYFSFPRLCSVGMVGDMKEK